MVNGFLPSSVECNVHGKADNLNLDLMTHFREPQQ